MSTAVLDERVREVLALHAQKALPGKPESEPQVEDIKASSEFAEWATKRRVDAARAELRKLTDRLDAIEATRVALLERRKELYFILLAADVQRKEIAEDARVTSGAVRMVIDPSIRSARSFGPR